MSANTEFADDDWCRSVCAPNATGDGRQTRATALATDASRAWPEKWCDPDFCTCIDAGLSHEDLVRRVQVQERKVPSGLPECLWPPPSGCSKDAVYECMQGPNAGQCGEENWFDKKDECLSSCVHASLLWWAPKDKEWIPGPVADDKTFDDTVPRYEHDKSKLKMENRGLALKKLSVTMSPACQGGGVRFVGISLHSPKYSAKADRLLRSCARVAICCQASLLPSNAFGQEAPEGSEEFRFELIAMKPAFILSSLELLGKPVAFLDVDLEFHSYPHLFDPGSWPDGPRDVALFNYWGNESNGQVVPSLGSGVVYFNDTSRSMHLARAWAEAMAFPANQQAPDDQVLTTMCSQGGWIKRASWGWLPVAYLRTMPAFYHGVDPVIDHDHGSAPGLIEHSDKTPTLPPVIPEGAGGPHHGPKMKCTSMQPQISKDWCESTCTPEQCDDSLCTCHKAGAAELRRDDRGGDDEAATAGFKMACSPTAASSGITVDWCEATCGENPAGCDPALCVCKQKPARNTLYQSGPPARAR